jgi:hypothetical protein
VGPEQERQTYGFDGNTGEGKGSLRGGGREKHDRGEHDDPPREQQEDGCELDNEYSISRSAAAAQ